MGDFVFLTTLVDICRIEFCRPTLKSHQNAIHSPMSVDTAPSVSSFQLSYRSLALVNFQSKYNIHPLSPWANRDFGTNSKDKG